MSQGIALEGMRLVFENLPRAYADGTDIEARGNMMVAAAMGATAFQKGLGAMHAMAHPVGALYDTHHGMTNAVVMPEVLKMNRPAIEDRIAAAAAYLGWTRSFDAFFDRVMALSAEMQVPAGLGEMGVDKTRIDELVGNGAGRPERGRQPGENDRGEHARAVRGLYLNEAGRETTGRDCTGVD